MLFERKACSFVTRSSRVILGVMVREISGRNSELNNLTKQYTIQACDSPDVGVAYDSTYGIYPCISWR